MITFSTIIPTYNSEATIAETIDGVLKQTRTSDEIIVVDDGSNDKTSGIIKKYREIQCIRQLNAGVSVARNSGVDKANGQWIAFCDADDIWHPEKLAIVEECIKDNPECNILFHNFYLFGGERDVTYKGVADTKETIFPIFRENKIKLKNILRSHYTVNIPEKQWSSAPIYYGDVIRWLILGNFVLPSTVIIRRDFFKKIGGFDPSFRTAEETEFFLRAAKHTQLHYVDLPLTGYRKSIGGLTSNVARLLKNGMKALANNVVNDPDIYSRYRRVINISIARRYSRLANCSLYSGQRLEALNMVLKGFKHSITEIQLWGSLIGIILPIKQLSMLKKRFTKIY